MMQRAKEVYFLFMQKCIFKYHFDFHIHMLSTSADLYTSIQHLHNLQY